MDVALCGRGDPYGWCSQEPWQSTWEMQPRFLFLLLVKIQPASASFCHGIGFTLDESKSCAEALDSEKILSGLVLLPVVPSEALRRNSC